MNRRTLLLALSLTPGIGSKTISRTLSRNELLGTRPQEFLELGEMALRDAYGWNAKQAGNWLSSRDNTIDQAQGYEDRLDRCGVDVVCTLDARYPTLVEAFDPDPPGVLFLYGNAKLTQAPTFAVMASRKAPPSALDSVETATEEGVLLGQVLVCGHDTPEYQRAAVVPLRWGAPRVIVLDCGLFTALGENLDEEPFRAARLWRYRFDPTSDLVLSPVRPERSIHANAHRLRDRLVAGLANRIDMPWVNEGGNMERLALMAMRAGRVVRVGDGSAARRLILAGAEPLAK